MKRNIFTFVMMLSLFLMASITVHAQAPDAKAPKTASSTTTDRDKISSAVMDMLQQWDSEAYGTVAGLLQTMLKYDTSVLGDWGIESLEAMKQPDNITMLLKASTLTGKFKVTNDRWVKESDADFLQFTFPAGGRTCVAKLTAEGNKGTISLPVDEDDVEDFVENIEDEDSPYHFLSKSVDKVKNILEGVEMVDVDVPETMSLVFKYGNFEMMNSQITIDDISGGDDDSGLFFSANVKFFKEGGGTFEIVLNNSGYMPNDGVKLDFAAKKDGNSLLTMKLDVPGTFTGLDLTTLDFGFESLNIDMDVMGEVQVKGGITDMTAFLQSMSPEDGEDFEASIKKANEYMNINFYYDGTNEVRAYLELQAYQNEKGRWRSNLVIHFKSDDQTYTFAEYFTKERFPEVSDRVNELAEEFEELVEAIKNKASGSDEGDADVADDVSAAVGYILGNPPSGFDKADADRNNDNKLNIADIIMRVNAAFTK